MLLFVKISEIQACVDCFKVSLFFEKVLCMIEANKYEMCPTYILERGIYTFFSMLNCLQFYALFILSLRQS